VGCSYQFTVNINDVLSPPLEHPTSAEPPLGVCTLTLIAPGPEITPVVNVTFICSLLLTVALKTLPSTTACEDATNWPPFMISVIPCCTCAKLTVLGDSDPISGTGLALPHNGFSVLLHPGSKATTAIRHKPLNRENIDSLPVESGPNSSFGHTSAGQRSEARLLFWRFRTPHSARSFAPRPLCFLGVVRLGTSGVPSKVSSD